MEKNPEFISVLELAAFSLGHNARKESSAT